MGSCESPSPSVPPLSPPGRIGALKRGALGPTLFGGGPPGSSETVGAPWGPRIAGGALWPDIDDDTEWGEKGAPISVAIDLLGRGLLGVGPHEAGGAPTDILLILSGGLPPRLIPLPIRTPPDPEGAPI